MSTNSGGIQHLICDISDLVHDVSSLLSCSGGNTGSAAQPTQGSGGGSCVQAVIQHVLNEICCCNNNNIGGGTSQPVSFQTSGPSGGICDIVQDAKDIACDIVGLIPSGCGDINPTPSDLRLKEDIVPLDFLANGLGLYRFRYKGHDEQYVGVMAQEVEQVRPDAVVRGSDGYLRVYYDRLGLEFMKWDQWPRSRAS